MIKMNLQKTITCYCALLFVLIAEGQHKTENLVIVTLDGMRWQEVFKGVDEALMNDSTYNRDIKKMKEKFWDDSEVERRKKLFPFLWNVVADQYAGLVGIHDAELTGTAHNNLGLVAVLICCIYCTNAFEFNYTGKLRADACFRCNVGCSTTHVEGAERKLCTGLTD